MWVLMSVPLAFVGGYFASKKEPCKYPVRTNQIPREIAIKNTSVFAHPLFIVFLSGLLPFGVMYVDLYFIFSAMFEHLYYYAFGFLFGMTFITALVCIEVSILLWRQCCLVFRTLWTELLGLRQWACWGLV